MSRNTALTILRIFKRRKVDGERNGGNPYGFKTWWLTQQTRVQNATGQLVAKERARYMMRPEFILHFLAAIPSASAVQNSYDSIFPTILDDSRAQVLLAKASTQLQSDFSKQYEDSVFFQKT